MIEALEQEGKSKENEIISLQKEVFALQKGPADKVLIEKKERRLTLISKGKVLKTYKIALGETRMAQKKGKAITKPGGNLRYRFKKQGQPLSPVSSYFLSKRERQKAGKRTWCFSGRRHHDPRY